jgi:hypothetical protein
LVGVDDVPEEPDCCEHTHWPRLADDAGDVADR